jgi:hypothetical protein
MPNPDEVPTLDITGVEPDLVALAHEGHRDNGGAENDPAIVAAIHAGDIAMSPPPTFPQMIAAFQRWHLPVTEVVRGGVKARSHYRPASLGWGDLHGLLLHHTGPFSSVSGMLALLWDGRSDLPGPLCTYSTAPDGHVYVISGGRSNHAGNGAQNVYSAILADKPAPNPGPDKVDGNAHLYGNEIMSAGASSSVYPDVQVESSVRAAAALFEHHGWKGTSAVRHGTWTTRKVDTAGASAHGDRLTTGFWQAEIQRALTLGPDRYAYPAKPAPAPKPHPAPAPAPHPAPAPAPAPRPAPTPVPVDPKVLEEIMASDADIKRLAQAIAAEVWAHPLSIGAAQQKAYGYTKSSYQAGSYLVDASWRARAASSALSKALATIKGWLGK